MPVMTGLELARAVRGDGELQALPLIAVSASASIFSRDEALAAGCNHFLAKPVRAEDLFALAGQILNLTWRTTGDPAGDGDKGARSASIEGVRVASHCATELYDLAMRGDVKELIAVSTRAAADDPQGAPVYEEIQRLARTFDMKGIRRVLQDARADQR